MKKGGPKPVPAAIRILNGTHRNDRHGDPSSAVIPPDADLTIPVFLGEHGRRVWGQMAPMLANLGVMTSGDRLAFETYCRSFDEVAKCDAVLEKEGEYFESGESGYIGQHPAVNQRFKWLDIKRRYECEFGMTPSSRNGVRGAEKKASGVAKRERA